MATHLREIVTRRRLAYAGFAAASFLAVVSLTAAALEPLRPSGYVEELSEKIAYLEANRDDIDIIVIGSSRVYRELDPAQVELGIVESGCAPQRVFNFGLSGMSAPLMAKLSDYIDATTTRHQLVLFEPDLPLGPEYDLAVTDRSRFSNQWSTIVPGVLQLGTYFDGSGRSLLESGKLYVKYAVSFVRTGLGVGRLRDFVLSRATKPQSLPNKPGLWDQGGFYSLDQELAASSGIEQVNLARRRTQVISADGRAKFLLRFQALQAVLREPIAATTLQRAYLDYILQRTSPKKVTSGFIFMPANYPPIAIRVAAMRSYLDANHSGTTVINAGLPNLPELYQPEWWFDPGHLTAAGAERVSHFIGAQICKRTRLQVSRR
jgi:hypothetical protein